MGAALKYGLIFVGGVAVGLLIAKQYARAQVNSAIGSALDSVGLGKYAATVEGLVTPQVVG